MTEENRIAIGELVGTIKPSRPATNASFDTLKSTVCVHVYRFFYRVLV